MNVHPSPDLSRWRFAPLVLAHLAAGALWLTWAFEPGAGLWRAVDEAAFYAMNGLIGLGEAMPTLWAAMNTKAYDNINGAVMVLFAMWAFGHDRTRPLTGRMALFALLSAAILLGVLVSKEVFDFVDKLSPSLALPAGSFYDLAELAPTIKAKTGSDQSFPADHGVVTFIYAGFFLFTAARRYIAVAMVIGLLNALPRMVGGAHWLSDTIVGGGMFALVALSWTLATPALVWAEASVIWALRRVGLGRFT